MADGTSFFIGDLDLRPGDPFRQVCTMNGPAIITRFDGVTITYRAWRWYDGPRLWFRGLWRKIRGRA